MIKKKVLILGSSGQLGRHLIRKLTKNNYKVICQTRNAHKSVFLKTSGSIGYIDIIEANIFDTKKIEELISSVDICVNLIGILYEKDKHNSFENIHAKFPKLIANLCKENSTQFIHISALGVEKMRDSLYANSKTKGEIFINETYNKTTIIKPSVVFSVDDSFTTRFLGLINIMPFFPLYYNGMTKFSPIHASDVANLIYFVISNGITSKTIEAIGPEILTFKQIIQTLMKSVNKNKILIPLPTLFAKFTASIFQKFPNPLSTIDQLKLLRYDNVKSDNGLTNYDINCKSKILFEEGVMRYAYNWQEGGQYSLLAKNIKK